MSVASSSPSDMDMSASDSESDIDMVIAHLQPPQLVVDSAPILLLNYDILGCIFMLNADPDEFSHRPSHTTRRTSQVCRKWRAFALQYQALWASCIDFADPLPWVQEVVTRSGSLPIANLALPSLTPTSSLKRRQGLDLARRFMYDKSDEHALRISSYILRFIGSEVGPGQVELATSLFQRAKHISVMVDNNEDWAQVTANLVQPSPALEHLALIFSSRSRESVDDKLPQNLFDGHAPNLTALELLGCTCAFDTARPLGLFANLTVLVVVQPSEPNRRSARAWLAVLRRMPLLERLQLTACFKKTLITISPAQLQIVRLPHLEALRLSGNTAHCSTVFARLEVPPACKVILNFQRPRVDDECFSAMASSMQERLGAVDAKQRRLISVHGSPTALGFHKTYMDLERAHKEVDFYFRCHCSSRSGPDLTPIYPTVLAALRVAGSETADLHLNLHKQSVLGEARIVEVLSLFDKVENLTLDASDTVRWFLSVANTPRDGRLLLPALRSITIKDVHFGDDPELGYLIDVAKPEGHRPQIRGFSFINCTLTLNFVDCMQILGLRVTIL